jgi:membrane peptidoglycan carboxypeptidase
MDRHRRTDSDEIARKQARQRKLIALGAVVIMLLGFVVLAGTYFVVSVPAPKDLAKLSENSRILSSNGKPLAKVGTENRKYVPIAKIPAYVQHAVVVAEDRSFYTNSGIDVKGIIRAAWNNVTDDDVEGASTITQQYVRNALDLTREQSYTRKLKEAVMAVKLSQQKSKDEILEGYLNTIYFGRNANGIGAAAEAYFGKPVEKLTEAEGALLATVIKNPSGYDPANRPDRAEERWRWVLDSLVEAQWLDPQKASAAKFPKTISAEKATGAQAGLNTPTGNVVKYVVQELEAAGISEQELYTGGYTITTTIHTKAQRAAERAVETVLKGQSKKMTAALVGVQPGTGRVLAYYGSKQGVVGWDNAAARHQPGSSFKAYVLAAALENDVSVKSYWDGSSPQEFPDRTKPVRNSENNNRCPRCTLEQATVMSLNTAYYAVTADVGKERVIRLANKAGIRTMKRDSTDEVVKLDEPGAAGKFGNEVGIGQYPISVLDNANGFATFAAGGVAAKVHFVDKVMRDEQVVFKSEVDTTRAFSEDTAADATHVLRKVVGAGGDDLYGGRPAAGKTGTWQFRDTDDNAHAWMAGYTPQLAAAVWMGRSGDEGALVTRDGQRVYGSGLPADIWKAFMNGALNGREIEQFPEPVFGGDVNAGNLQSPTPSPPGHQPDKPGRDKPGGGPVPPTQPTYSPEPLPSATPTETCNPLDPKCKPGG